MAVHVDEVHADVVSSGASGRAPTTGPRPDPPGVAEERWRDARCRADWLAGRVRAEAFDD
jgi:hypothetical protein